MRRHLTVRALAYGVLAVAIVAVVLLGFAIYRQGIGVPRSILNLNAAQRLAARYGLGYSLDSLRIGCLARSCPGEVDAGTFNIEVKTPQPFHLRLDGVQWGRSSPVNIGPLEIRSGTRPPLITAAAVNVNPSSNRVAFTGLRVGLSSNAQPAVIDRVDFDGAAKRVDMNGIHVQRADGPPITVERVQLHGWNVPAPGDEIVFDRAEVAGIKLTIDESGGRGGTFCEALQFNSTSSGDAIEPLRGLLPFFKDSLLKFQQDLLRLAVVLGALVVLLKFLTVLWLKRWATRLLVTPIPVLLAFALYFNLPDAWPAGRVLLVAAALIAGVAVAFRLFVYRVGQKWYQRWEPFAADLASIVILLPLLGYGYQLPEPPSAPQKLRLERLQLVSISGRSDTGVQFDIPQVSATETRVSFPNSTNRVVEFAISAVEVPSAAIVASSTSRLNLDATRVENMTASYDAGRKQIHDLFARVRLAGLFESAALGRELRNLEFLRGTEPRTTRIGFALDVTAETPDGNSQIRNEFSQPGYPIALNAVATFEPVDCTATYDVLARVLTPSLKWTARADGDAGNVYLRSVRSLPGSSVQIASGSGHVALGSPITMEFNLDAIDGQVRSSQLSLASLGISASLPAAGKSGKQALSLSLGPMGIQSSDGMQIRFGRAAMSVDREPSASNIPLRFHTQLEDVRLDRRTNGILEADFPVVETLIEGSTTSELIPNSFAGTASFRVSSAAGELLGLASPLSVHVDLWKGALDIPEQLLALRGALLSAAPNLPVRVGLSGQLSSMEPQLKASLRGHAGVARIEQAIGSGRVVADDIRVDAYADWENREVSGKLNLATGWIDARLPPRSPLAFCLDEVSTLDLTTEGKASRIPSLNNVETQAASTTVPSTCAVFPSSTPEARIRLGVTYPTSAQQPLIRLENASGRGIRIGNVASEMRVLRIREGRITETDSRLSATGIQTLEGLGGFDAHADIRRSGNSLDLSAGVLTTGGMPLLTANLTRKPDKITLDATQQASADQILDQLRPFLSDLNLDLEGITPETRLARLQAEANFEGDALADVAATAEFANGPMISIERPDLKMNISSPATTSGPALRLGIGKPQQAGAPRNLVALIDLPGSSISAVTNEGVSLEAKAKLRLDIRGSLLETDRPPASPVLEKLFDVGTGINRNVSALMGIVGSDREPADPIRNIDWKLSLSQRSPDQPLLRFTPAAIHLNAAVFSYDTAWDGSDGAAERSKVAGSSALDTTIALDGDQVLVDALPSIQMLAGFNGEPEMRFDATLPLQLAFGEKLRERRLPGDSLWDAGHYADFWRAHPSRFAGAEITSPVNISEVATGSLSIRQILFPVEPIRALVGYKDSLQIGLPFSGRALFGAFAGNFESNLTPMSPAISLDMRLNVDLKSIQMGAVGSVRGGGHSAFVEDELDGRTSVRLDGLMLDGDTVAAFTAGKPDNNALQKLGMSVHLFRSPESADIPAVLQASTDIKINLANEVLNHIANGLRLSGPPRALRYREFDLKFDVDRGIVRNDREILRLGGLQILSTDLVDVAGEIRTHLGSPGERVRLRDMIEMLSGIISATEAEER
jgi:hypothetical protein